MSAPSAIRSPGPLGRVTNRRDRAPSAYLRFSVFVFHLPHLLFKGMRNAPHRSAMFEATMKGWARLNPAQRERFFQAGLRAALAP